MGSILKIILRNYKQPKYPVIGIWYGDIHVDVDTDTDIDMENEISIQ